MDKAAALFKEFLADRNSAPSFPEGVYQVEDFPLVKLMANICCALSKMQSKQVQGKGKKTVHVKASVAACLETILLFANVSIYFLSIVIFTYSP